MEDLLRVWMTTASEIFNTIRRSRGSCVCVFYQSTSTSGLKESSKTFERWPDCAEDPRRYGMTVHEKTTEFCSIFTVFITRNKKNKLFLARSRWTVCIVQFLLVRDDFVRLLYTSVTGWLQQDHHVGIIQPLSKLCALLNAFLIVIVIIMFSV